jgi:hypothetical protein
LFDKDDKQTVFATPWSNPLEKRLAEIYLRLQIASHNAVAYGFCTEAWLSDKSKTKDMIPASESENRQEVVVAFAVTREEKDIRSWIIKRDWHERVISLELKHPFNDPTTSPLTFTSWMTELLT